MGLILIGFATANFTEIQTLKVYLASQQTKVNTDSQDVQEIAEETTEKSEKDFADLLFQKENYLLPFGAAEIEGYFTTVEQETSLDYSTPRVACSAFIVTNGPDLLLKALEDEFYEGLRPVVLGPAESDYSDRITNSTKENPVRVIATLNPLFEGEHISCMSWPFSSIIEIE